MLLVFAANRSTSHMRIRKPQKVEFSVGALEPFSCELHVYLMLFVNTFFSCLVGFSFQALLVDPPWRQTQAESEGEESQGKGWEGSDASDASDGSDGSGRSPAVAKPSDKAGTAVRFVSVQLWHGSAIALSGTAVARQNSFAEFLQTLRRRRRRRQQDRQDRQDAETVTAKTWRAEIRLTVLVLLLLLALVQRRVRRVRRVVTSCFIIKIFRQLRWAPKSPPQVSKCQESKLGRVATLEVRAKEAAKGATTALT